MSDSRHDMPLLSGPPPTLAPPNSEIACRKCNKEFHIFFVRSRKCNHCGYSYCHACSDFQALMPRSGSDIGGYEPMNVCGFCIEFLAITAGGRKYLKSLPLGKLRQYATSYGIATNRAVEKDDIIDAVVAARGSNGCLPPAYENYYRKHSVPNKVPSERGGGGLFFRSGQSSSSDPPRVPPRPASGPTYEFPRPDLEQDVQFQSPPGPPPRPHQHPAHNPSYGYTPPHHYYSHHEPPPQTAAPGPSRANNGGEYHQSYGGHIPSTPSYTRRPQGNYQGYGGHVPPTPSYMTRPQQQPPQRPNDHFQPSPPRAAPYSSSPPRAPPLPTRPASVAPPPNLEQLVEMNTESIGSLSISALKSILFTNHVTTGQILEKGDLVQKVLVLVENEKAERVRQRQMEEREEMERLQRAMETMHGTEEGTEGWSSRDRDQQANESEMHSDIPVNNSDRGNEDHPHSSSTPAASPPQSKPPGPIFDRPGMCVICQDEDANIAIIDCGHMAMCRGCSELVMESSKECPLCRTRIVTEARLLRIYRT